MDGAVVASGTHKGLAGDPVEAPLEMVPGPRLLHPRQVQAWRLGWGLGAFVVTVLTLLVEVSLAMADDVDPWWPRGAPTVTVAVIGGALAWQLPRLAYDAWRYELTPSTLELRRGVVVRRYSAIPYFRVQHIDITRSPFERALGLSQLVVRTAAATTDARLPGIAEDDGELLRDVILARTGSGDAV
ncbi:MAG TPA: PH domain-containing protein [Acidimicrobiales bacterium]|nr:PH domain-containing protein [Acidimicrobiales bacterium]